MKGGAGTGTGAGAGLLIMGINHSYVRKICNVGDTKPNWVYEEE